MTKFVDFTLAGYSRVGDDDEYNRLAVDISRILGVCAIGPAMTGIFVEGFDTAFQVKGSFDSILNDIEEATNAPVHDPRT